MLKKLHVKQVSTFIEECPDGYNSWRTWCSFKWSQRQRIGIARALYKQAQVIVLDDATSALDSATEQAVIHSMDLLSNKPTIIMIAHRLSTLQSCDRVIRLEKGRITAHGSPQQVLSAEF